MEVCVSPISTLDRDGTIDKDGYIDWDVWYVDGSNMHGHVAASGASEVSKTDPTNPSARLWVIHAGWGTKIHPMICGNGLPFCGSALA